MAATTKKDASSLKGVRTSFLFFAMDRRPKLREEMPGLTFSEYSVKIGELWAELSEEERAPYKKLAEADKKRHAEEKQTQDKKAKKKTTTSDEGEEEEKSSSSSSKRKRPRASKKVAGAPKGTTTAYLYYQNEISQEVRDSNPGIKFGDVAKICGARWKEMSEEDRAPFKQKAKEDKERYLKEMQAFEESRRNLVDDDEREDEEEKPTKSKAKRHSNDKAPSSNVAASEKKKKKKAVAAKGDNFYEEDDSSNPIIKYFISMCMSDVHSMNPRLSKDQVELILMDRWRQLPDDKKRIYEQCSVAQYSK